MSADDKRPRSANVTGDGDGDGDGNGHGDGAGADAGDHPTQIGPYRILDILGKGGMAVVYRAQQTSPITRQVALKMVKPGMDSERVLRRFQSEQQSLALMNHPNIAQVFDAGISENGRPYFVMELVSGQRIDEYCDANKLSTRQRIEIFLDVCAAVQHAHQKGVIHRDLKPSNILVSIRGNSPLPRVIDFGLAKALADGLAGDAPVTRLGDVLGTPRYMSPEQAGGAGLGVDTRTDVYSLGVLLYELLSGVPPLDLAGVADFAFHNVIREKEPQTPSRKLATLAEEATAIARYRRTDAVTLRKSLQGDLDSIVMKAMAKDPTRRFETVAALADDLRRHLAHEAVLAHPPSAAYKLRRFVRRNRVVVAAAGIAVLALVLGSVIATTGLIRARKAEQAQRVEAETARQVADFMVGMFRVADPGEARGNTITAREILDRAAARIDRELAAQPGVRVQLQAAMAEVYNALGLYAEARTLFDKALEAHAPDLATDGRLGARLLGGLGEVLGNLGQYERALTVLDDALGLLAGPQKEDRLARAATLGILGWVRHQSGDYLHAREDYEASLAIYENDAGVESIEAGSIINRLALVDRATGELDEAETLLRRALRIHRARLGTDHPTIAQIHNNLGSLLHERGDYAAAEPFYREALDMRRKLLSADHPNVLTTMNNLGILLRLRGQHADALDVLSQVLAIRSDSLDAGHPDIAFALNALGAVNHDMGNLAPAAKQLSRAVTIFEAALGAEHPNVAVTRTALADVLNDQGEFAAAAERASAARSSLAERLAPDHWRTAVADSVHGRALAGLGEFRKAEPLLLTSLPLIEAAKGIDDTAYTGRARERIVALYEGWNKPELARRYRSRHANTASHADPDE